MTIANFKGIKEISIGFNRLNVLIGANASGKTTIIQAIDFLFSSVFRDTNEYLKERNWKVNEIKSQFTSSRFIAYHALFEFNIEGKNYDLSWNITFQISHKDNEISLYKERLEISDSHSDNPDFYYMNRPYFSQEKPTRVFTYNQYGFLNTNGSEEEAHSSSRRINLSSSCLKILSFSDHDFKQRIVTKFREYIRNSCSLEMLSTDRMRHSSRGKTPDIGKGGERLAAFIKHLNTEQKKQLLESVKKLQKPLTAIDSITKSRPGWIELILSETYEENNLKIKTSHISDGTLRILAINSLLFLNDKNGMILLDEIEDGLNPYITTQIVTLLYDFIQNSSKQLIITTHSPLLLDDFKPEDIIYIYRNTGGEVQIQKVFGSEKIKEMLTYMNPGEIWINTTEKELLDLDEQV